MTKAHSTADDNDGRCERKPQMALPVMLGGGLGWGSLWLCPKCQEERALSKLAEEPAKRWTR